MVRDGYKHFKRSWWKHARRVCGILTLLPALVSADTVTIGFEAEIHTGNLNFSVHNTSDPNVLVSTVSFRLGTNMLFDTTLGGAAFDPLDVAFQESVGYQNTHFVNGPLGAPYTCLAGTAVGYSGSLAADILDGGTNATLNFTDFARGEAWGFYVDFDRRTANTNPAGADMNYAQIMVSFTLSGQFLDTLTYNFGTYSGSKKSFPTEMGNLNGPSKQVEFVPEPCAAVLTLAGASLLGLSRRRPLRISPGSYERELVDRNDWKPVS